MGMDADLAVRGFVPKCNKDWDAHATIMSTCNRLGIDPPPETAEFFENCELVDGGALISLPVHAVNFVYRGVTHEDEKYVDLQTPGYCDINLNKIPEQVTKVRVWIQISV